MRAVGTVAVDPSRGLSSAEVAERVARGAVNDVPAAPTRTVAQIVRANVLTRFNALLGAMLVLIAIVGPIQDALFGVVLVANALIGIVQELRAKRTLDRLTLLTAPKAQVVRDGGVRDVVPSDIVVDDVVALAPGSQIVVDGEVMVTDGLEVDESLLTGESETVHKRTGDRVLSGSFVAAGTGRSRATDVGAASPGRRDWAGKIPAGGKERPMARETPGVFAGALCRRTGRGTGQVGLLRLTNTRLACPTSAVGFVRAIFESADLSAADPIPSGISDR